MRRALVTGATGGLGRALVVALQAADYVVRATGRDPAIGAALRDAGVEFVPGDLRQPGLGASLTQGMDTVFHAAALSSPWGREAEFRAINVTATRTLLDSAQRSGCDGFVFISTPSIYAEPRDRLYLTEASPLPRRFANAYARTKFEAETLVRAAAAADFQTVVLRPRALVGPDDRVLLPRLLRIARTGRFPLFRGGRALIDLTDIRDAAEAALAADRHRIAASGRVFNISGGRPETVRAILGEVFAALGLSPRLVGLPYRPAAGAARLLEAACALLPGRPEPPATAYTLSTLAFSQTFDLAAARAILGWQPRFSPHQAIRRTAERWRHHAPL